MTGLRESSGAPEESADPAAALALAAFGATFWWVMALAAVPLVLAFFIPTRSALAA